MKKIKVSELAKHKINTQINRELFDKEIERLNKILPSVQERLETLNDLTPQVHFLLDEPFTINQPDWKSVDSDEGQKYLFSDKRKVYAIGQFFFRKY